MCGKRSKKNNLTSANLKDVGFPEVWIDVSLNYKTGHFPVLLKGYRIQQEGILND